MSDKPIGLHHMNNDKIIAAYQIPPPMIGSDEDLTDEERETLDALWQSTTGIDVGYWWRHPTTATQRT